MSTATLSDNTPLDPDDELLVAYLDGELDRKAQAELENRLLEEGSLRKRLQQLQTGWELLDELPNPSPGSKLVESTLELVVADIVKSTPRSPSWISRFKLPIVIGAICLAGILGTFAIAAAMKSQAYHQQLEDLAIAENLDAYNYGSDLALMRQLSANPDWSNMVAASREIGDIEIETIANVSATPVDQREELIKNLPLEKMDLLNARWERFRRMDEENRERIRRAAEAVAAQADAEFLLSTMQAYAIWRDRLPTELRDKIESSDGQDRRDAIKQAIQRTQVSISKRASLKLDDDSIDWIYWALRQIVQQRVDAEDQPTIDMLERAKSRGSTEDAEYFTIAAIVMSGTSRGGSRRSFSRMASSGGDRPAPLQPHELESISFALPNRALETLDLVAGGDPLQESTTLGIWAEEAIRRKFPFKRDDSTQLERYNAMDENARDVLDLLPPKEILNDLSPDTGRFRPPF